MCVVAASEIIPGGGQAPISGTGTATYNLAERSGRVTNATITVEESGQRWFIQSEIGKTALGDGARGIPPRFYGLGGTSARAARTRSRTTPTSRCGR